MTREHPTAISIIRRLRPSPDRFAAAAALQDPSLLLQLRAAAARGDAAARDVAVPGAMSGRLLSVNVGGPREVEWEGKTVRTAIWKEPVDGPRMVRRINIDGDDQADRLAHGGEHRAVFVYQIDSYRYWERELGRDDFTYGQFGENFTVDGLADDEVCIGDRYRIGGALFEVTQPRVTCYRVGIRMDEPAMPSLLVAHHRPGFYLRVLEEGQVQAGDAIVKVADGPERLTIAEVDALLYLPGQVARAARAGAARAGAERGLEGELPRAARQGRRRPPAPPAWTGFRPLRVAEVRRESATITSFRLVPTDDAPRARARGRASTSPCACGRTPTRPPLTRSYSLSDLAGERGYRISVKREGAASRYLHEHVKVGDVLDAAAPRGSFVLRDGDPPGRAGQRRRRRDPRARDAARAGRASTSTRPVWWLHGARNRDEHAFAAEVDALLAALADGHRLVAYSRPAPTTRSAPTTTSPDASTSRSSTGRRPDGRRLLRLRTRRASCARSAPRSPPAASRPSASPPRPSAPSPSTPRGSSRPATAPPHPPAGPPGTGPTVTFVAQQPRRRRGTTATRACSTSPRRATCPVGFGCRNGVCHNCESGLLAGAVTYTEDPLEPPPEGRVLVCCSRPASELALDL